MSSNSRTNGYIKPHKAETTSRFDSGANLTYNKMKNHPLTDHLNTLSSHHPGTGKSMGHVTLNKHHTQGGYVTMNDLASVSAYCGADLAEHEYMGELLQK